MVHAEEVFEEEGKVHEYRNSFYEILSEPTAFGNFVCGGQFEHGAYSPPISVIGVGKIGLPLSQEQAATLISVMEQAPYGKGSETVTDLTVRDVLQLDASNVLLDEKWVGNTLRSLVSKSCESLGLDAMSLQIEAHLYKLLLYKKGGHFKKHRDTEKEEGMFGSLIVQLESEHDGGELIVEHNGIVREYCFSKDSAEKPAFVAFFADCEHTLKAVTSGLRLVLAFNLVMKSTTGIHTIFKEDLPSAVKACELLSDCIQDLNTWEEDEDGPEKLVWKLEHQYTETNLTFSRLKGNDRAAVQALRSIRDRETGMELLDMYLVLMEKHESGEPEDYNCDFDDDKDYEDDEDDDDEDEDDDNHNSVHGNHNMGEIFETKTSILRWVGFDGVANFKAISIDIGTEGLNNTDEEDLFEGDPEREEYEGYTGNAGPSLDYWYHAALLVFWPKSKSLTKALENDLSVAMRIVKEKFECHQEDAEESLTKVFSNIERQFESFVQKAKATIGIDNSFALLLSLCSLSSNLHSHNSFIKSALKLIAKPMKAQAPASTSIGVAGPLTAMQIVKLLENYDMEAMQPEIGVVLNCVHHLNALHAANLVISIQSISSIPRAVRVIVASRVASALSSLSLQLVPSNSLTSLLRMLCACDGCEQSDLSLFLKPDRWQHVPLTILADLIAFIASSSALEDGPLSSAKDSLQEFLLQMIQTVILCQSNLNARTILAIFKSTMHLCGPTVWQQPKILRAFVDKIIIHPGSSPLLKVLLSANEVTEGVRKGNEECMQLCSARLLSLVGNPPVFSWRMSSAVMPTHPEVERFLRSDAQAFTVHGLNGIKHARNFVSKYCSSRATEEGYSISGSAGGTGSGAFVQITKTRAYFDSTMSQYNEKQLERERLQALLPYPTDSSSTSTVVYQAVDNKRGTIGSPPGVACNNNTMVPVAPVQSLAVDNSQCSSAGFYGRKRPLGDTVGGGAGGGEVMKVSSVSKDPLPSDDDSVV